MDIKARISKLKLLASGDIEIISDDIVKEVEADKTSIWISWLAYPIIMDTPINVFIQNTLGSRYGTLTLSSNGKTYIIDTYHKEVTQLDSEVTSVWEELCYNTIYMCKPVSDKYRFAVYSIMDRKLLGVFDVEDYNKTHGLYTTISFKGADSSGNKGFWVMSIDGLMTAKQYENKVRMQHARDRQRAWERSHGIHRFQ